VKIDMKARRELLAEIPEAKKCFQCSTCAASCMVLRYSGDFNPRILIARALCGDADVVASAELWKCATCAQCDERCPQGVNPFEVLMTLKNIAARKGLAPESRVAAARTIALTGLAFPMSSSVDKRREKLGLEPVSAPADQLAGMVSLVCDVEPR
jgi:heterodisulfide reductase subunit C